MSLSTLPLSDLDLEPFHIGTIRLIGMPPLEQQEPNHSPIKMVFPLPKNYLPAPLELAGACLKTMDQQLPTHATILMQQPYN